MSEGLRLLSGDISSGHINNVMNKYENSLGDYLFVLAVKSSV